MTESLIKPEVISDTITSLKAQVFVRWEQARCYPTEHKRFCKKHGRPLNLSDPQTFNEKVVWKKLHDRNPLLPIAADKYRVRHYVERVLGGHETERLTPPLLHVTDAPETLPFDKLPDEYVIKANHGSGTNIIKAAGRPLSEQAVIRQCQRWLRLPYGLRRNEWAYQAIPRRIVAEPLIRRRDGRLPADAKFYIFHGHCYCFSYDEPTPEGLLRTHFDQEGRPLPVRRKYPAGGAAAPKQFKRMMAIAERVSVHFDFIRVDFMVADEAFYLGELTHYPGGGRDPFDPVSFDYTLGAQWSLRRDYWQHSDTLALIDSLNTAPAPTP